MGNVYYIQGQAPENYENDNTAILLLTKWKSTGYLNKDELKQLQEELEMIIDNVQEWLDDGD